MIDQQDTAANLRERGVEAAAKTAAERAIEARTALLEAKGLLKHGEWLPWLREHCAISERTAQFYMKIVRLGLKSETVAVLGLAAAAKAVTIHDPSYRPFAHCDAAGERAWHLFILFLLRRPSSGFERGGAAAHVEWLLQKQFRSPCAWLGDEGSAWRAQIGMSQPSPKFVNGWIAFEAEHRGWALSEIIAAVEVSP